MAGPTSNAAPSRRELQKYSVMRPGWEAIKQSLYDYQAYAAAGTQQLSFFQVPVGQGGKTASDTNMQLAGQLANGQEFLVQSIEVVFFPTTPTVAADMPAAFGAQKAAVLVNDAFIFGRSGNLQFKIGTKDYLNEAPLGRFPAKTHLSVNAALADTSTVAASLQSRIAYPKWEGRPYLISPVELYLKSNVAFGVFLNWPEGAQAITNPARVGVILDGILYRQSQ